MADTERASQESVDIFSQKADANNALSLSQNGALRHFSPTGAMRCPPSTTRCIVLCRLAPPGALHCLLPLITRGRAPSFTVWASFAVPHPSAPRALSPLSPPSPVVRRLRLVLSLAMPRRSTPATCAFACRTLPFAARRRCRQAPRNVVCHVLSLAACAMRCRTPPSTCDFPLAVGGTALSL
eukprot:2145687-Pleurochrysis_carterae.AAC.1